MTNSVQLVSQEATVVVHGSSRYNGGKFDEVMVRTTIVTNGPLTESYYVPSGSSLSNEAIALIQKQGLEFRPYRESELLAETEDVHDVSKAGDVEGTERDVARLLLRSSLVNVPLQQIAQLENGQYVYEVKYEYKLFPVENETYEFQIRLPFDGTQMINGSEVKLTILTPIGGTIDESATKGIDENGQEIQEVVQQLVQTGRVVTTFAYRLDPLFTVRYAHTNPVLNNLINQ
ncbi:hypothetical protein [Bacillus manliponensis]|uniref:hypothetical protein n=1 Tax=Bacillus manliponensis TaxID=574376 RepID=UPI003517A0B3